MLLRGKWKGRQSLGLWRLDNRQPSQSSICTAQQVGLKWLSHTPDSLSACAIRTPFTGGWPVKFSQSGEKPCWVSVLSLSFLGPVWVFLVQMLRTLALCRILEVKNRGKWKGDCRPFHFLPQKHKILFIPTWGKSPKQKDTPLCWKLVLTSHKCYLATKHGPCNAT